MRVRFLLLLMAVIAVGLVPIVSANPAPLERQGVGHPVAPAGDNDSDDASDASSDSSSDDSSDDRPAHMACRRAAGTMLTSCRFEVQEEFYATVASCLNLADADARDACLESARDARGENRQLCQDQRAARLAVCTLLDEDIYDPDPLTDEATEFIDPDDIGDGGEPPNPYFSLEAGHTYVLRAGEGFEETVVVLVTDETIEVLGAACRVVVDIVLLQEDGEYEAVEVTDDFYAQSAAGDIYYCGEIARNFEDGLLTDLDGSFLAGRDFAKSGILIKANPVLPDAHRQEYKIGEAEDVIRYVGLAETPGADELGDHPDPAFSCAANGGCLKTEEFIPPEPDAGEYKYYVRDVGFVLGVNLENGKPTGERDELVCSGDSLAILETDCSIDNPEQLREELCLLSAAFCE